MMTLVPPLVTADRPRKPEHNMETDVHIKIEPRYLAAFKLLRSPRSVYTITYENDARTLIAEGIGGYALVAGPGTCPDRIKRVECNMIDRVVADEVTFTANYNAVKGRITTPVGTTDYHDGMSIDLDMSSLAGHLAHGGRLSINELSQRAKTQAIIKLGHTPGVAEVIWPSIYGLRREHIPLSATETDVPQHRFTVNIVELAAMTDTFSASLGIRFLVDTNTISSAIITTRSAVFNAGYYFSISK